MRGIKNKEEGKWKRVVVFLMLFLVFGVLLNSTKNVYQKKKLAEEALIKMEEEKSKLAERNKFLKASMARINTEEGLKFEMRKKLNVAEVGESVAIIVDETPSTTNTNTQISTWQKFKNFWLGIFR